MPRKTTIATLAQCGIRGQTVADTVERVVAMLDPVWANRPDIVCLPEAFATSGLPLSRAEKSEPLPGPTTERFAEIARAHHCHILCPVAIAREGRFYNSVVLLDRRGGIVGVYDKVQPVTSNAEFTCFEDGVSPGRDVPVFDLDCGRIGIQTCFDIEFPETWQALEDAGAELVVWDSAYDGGFPLQAYAYLHSYYVVSSVRGTRSRIINPLGEVLDETGSCLPMAVRTIDLDYLVGHHDFHHGILRDMIRIHGSGVTVRILDRDGRFMVESNNEEYPLNRLIEEFGLVSRREYAARHRKAYAQILAGQEPETQEPAFRGRRPYASMTRTEWRRNTPA